MTCLYPLWPAQELHKKKKHFWLSLTQSPIFTTLQHRSFLEFAANMLCFFLIGLIYVIGFCVQSFQTVISDRPKIINLPSEYNASVLQSLSLDCQAEGNPKPSFTWTPCEDGCNNSTLVIPEVWNDTVYTCNVTNSLGSDLAEASIGKLHDCCSSETISKVKYTWFCVSGILHIRD